MTNKNKPISASNPPESRGTRTNEERKELRQAVEPIIEEAHQPKKRVVKDKNSTPK